jgi:hypothetical protein
VSIATTTSAAIKTFAGSTASPLTAAIPTAAAASTASARAMA